MLKHIHISELRLGMYVVNPDIDWTQRPFLYTSEGYINTNAEIAKIESEGFQELYIDPERSTANSAGITSLPDKKNILASLKPRVAMAEEMPKAVKVHDESVAYAKRFMNDMRSGKLNISSATATLEGILGSLERNADALMSLSRLHQRDSYTYTHCVNVCILTTLYSRYLGESSDKVFAAGLAGMFHDLGKAMVPPQILNAPRKLSDEEFTIMKGHPMLGYEQLVAVPGILPDVLMGAVQHHEKHNGKGYPDGLAGDEISSIGRMVGVSDVYDALTSKRVYKDGMPPHKALAIMYEMRDQDFHPEYIAGFIRMVGVYPMGSVVELSDGAKGVISQSNPEFPSKPVVTVLKAPDGHLVPRYTVDLAGSDSAGINIARCLTPEETGINPSKVLNLPH